MLVFALFSQELSGVRVRTVTTSTLFFFAQLPSFSNLRLPTPAFNCPEPTPYIVVRSMHSAESAAVTSQHSQGPRLRNRFQPQPQPQPRRGPASAEDHEERESIISDCNQDRFAFAG